MISRLQIQGLAIIDSLAIDFTPGFNVITGETGAGKSILIRALSFLLGQKVGPDVVRQGHEQASVVGEFLLPEKHEALLLLSNLGIPFEVENASVLVIIRRQVALKGRSGAWVNDVAMTSGALRELSGTLIDVFGQHDNQRLMKPEFHTRYLDQFLEGDSVNRVKALRKRCDDVLKEILERVSVFLSRAKDEDYLSFRLEELNQFAPSLVDFQSVLAISEQSDQGLELKEGLETAARNLEAEGESISDRIWECAKGLRRLSDKLKREDLAALADKAEHGASVLDEVSFEIDSLGSGLDFDESALEDAQKRLFGYQELFRKHGVRDVEALVAAFQTLERDCQSAASFAEALRDSLAELAKDTAKLRTAAEGLGRLRMKTAASVKKSVQKELGELAMPGSLFDVRFEPVQKALPPFELAGLGVEGLAKAWAEATEPLGMVGEEGMERAEFLLASNPGEPVMPLLKIASGGELSRIMLALKKALVADASTCVLVFDEIDTGISGRVADVVGKKMRELSSGFQVICISHLPQVAVYADTHFLVKKSSHKEKGKDVRTESTIVRLSREESAREIGRLLSGAELSASSLANAKSLMEKAKKATRAPSSRV